MNKIKKGDIYKVGNHIIGCGDSTDKNFVKAVVGERKIKAIITDPPYGVAYVENKKGIVDLNVSKEIKGDHLQTEYEYSRFTEKWLKAISPHLDDYNTFHIFNSDLMFLALRTGIVMAVFHFSQMLIWLKNQSVMGRMDYLPQHELIAYGWYKKHKREKSQSKSLIFHPRPQKSELHSTQKPVSLMRKIISRTSKIDDYVYDGFLGSGTTAVASEHLKRKCIGIEYDPEYIEIILKRLEKLTKQKQQFIINYEHGK